MKQDSPLCRVNRYIKTYNNRWVTPYQHQEIRVRFSIREQRRHPFNESWLNNTGDHQQRREISYQHSSVNRASCRKTTKLSIRENIMYNKAGGVQLLLNIDNLKHSLERTIAEFQLNRNKLYNTVIKTHHQPLGLFWAVNIRKSTSQPTRWKVFLLRKEGFPTGYL